MAPAIAALIAVPFALGLTNLPSDEAGEPRAGLAAPTDQARAGGGDVAAAGRLLSAGGWSATPDSVREVVGSSAAGIRYTLFRYCGSDGSGVLLIGDAVALGSVHAACGDGPAALRICGSAVQSDPGHALVLGQVDPRADAVQLTFDDGSALAATLEEGFWFARVQMPTAAALPRTIVATRAGSTLSEVEAGSLRDHITSTRRLAAARAAG